jgi:hypothetical protein
MTDDKQVYFLQNGLASVVANNKDRRLEVGLVGRDGTTGIAVVLGNGRSPNETSSRLGVKAGLFLPRHCEKRWRKVARWSALSSTTPIHC